MFKVKLTSNFFISLTAAIALGVVGCGGSDNQTGTGGAAGGKAGAGGGATAGKGGGTAGAPAGGRGGSIATGGATAGAAGTSTGGAAGGTAGAGATGAGGAGGGGVDKCGETRICTMGMTRCAMGQPQTCQLDAMMCPYWGPTPGQPMMCSANQTCVDASGTCKCNDDPACGTPPKEGDFCPTPGAATHSSCVKQADGCYTVTAGTACAAGQTCNMGTSGMPVATGASCGCPPAAADQTGKTVKLIGTGCPTENARVGSAMDDAVLVCGKSGGCLTWQLMVPCAMQQLTGGTDPATGMPACVCKAPGKANQYWVDPDPAMSTFMNGAPTGAQFPAACRFRTLTTALAQPGVTEVVSQHESSSNVHFLTDTGLAGVTGCTLPNTCEAFPLVVPANVHMYTADVGSFNPNHYVVDIDATGNADYGILLSPGAIVEGYTFDASATTPLNAGCKGAAPAVVNCNAGAPISNVLVSPGANNPAALAPFSATLTQVQVFTRSVTTNQVGTYSGQTGVLVQGQGAWTANYLTIVGGAGGTGSIVNRGIQLAKRQNLASAALALDANHLNIVLNGGANIGIDVGEPVEANATGAVLNTVRVVNDATDHTNGRGVRVGNGGIGINVYKGTVTTTGLDIASSTAASNLVGVNVMNSNSPAAMGVNLNSTTIVGGTLSGNTAAGGGQVNTIGVLAIGGYTTINQSHITGGNNFVGVSVQSSSPITATSIAGNVTITGSAAAKSVIDTIAATNSTPTAGIIVGSGVEYTTGTVVPSNLSTLTINDNTTVMGYRDGMVINNGHVVSTGTGVSFTANFRDGIEILSDLNIPSTNPMDPLSRVAITGASITGNGRGGILARGIAPVVFDTVKVTGNGTPLAAAANTPYSSFAAAGNVAFGGIDVQRSQMTSGTAFLFTLKGSTVSGNNGCGITLSGGADDLVNRTGDTGSGIRVCGFGGTGLPGGDPNVTAGAQQPGAVTAATAAIGTVFGGRTNSGGKVSATLQNNTVQNNTGVGIYVTESREDDPAFGGTDDVTEATIQGNKVTGNLSSVPSAGTEPSAGGIYIAQSNWTMVAGTMAAPDTIGCEDAASTLCTRIRMETFLGNVVECNGRAQLSYAIPQRVSNTGAGSAWDISSNPSLVGVTLADRCTAPATPNTLAGYSPAVQSAGLAIPGSATDATLLVSLVHVKAYGVIWNTSTLASGTDYSSSLAAAPQGNNDAAAWGVCPGATAVTCPIALAP